MRPLLCLLNSHDWEFVSRTADWLLGGTYTYKCKRCDKTIHTRPYQGGEY